MKTQRWPVYDTLFFAIPGAGEQLVAWRCQFVATTTACGMKPLLRNAIENSHELKT